MKGYFWTSSCLFHEGDNVVCFPLGGWPSPLARWPTECCATSAPLWQEVMSSWTTVFCPSIICHDLKCGLCVQMAHRRSFLYKQTLLLCRPVLFGNRSKWFTAESCNQAWFPNDKRQDILERLKNSLLYCGLDDASGLWIIPRVYMLYILWNPWLQICDVFPPWWGCRARAETDSVASGLMVPEVMWEEVKLVPTLAPFLLLSFSFP